MKPYYDDGQIQIYAENALDLLPQLPAESVQCVVTSPPYWGLRKYAGEQEMIWGDNHCEHEWAKIPDKYARWAKELATDCKQETEGGTLAVVPQGNTCQLCNAWRGAYGLEPTPEMYVEHTVEFLRAIRRVLRKDGVVFLNIGDSYATHASKRSGQFGKDIKAGFDDIYTQRKTPAHEFGLKEKDLCLIPFRVALAAQADGWWIRSVIIWSKKNPMPESVKDRPTESHEYLLMLTRSARYYWDQEAVREPIAESTIGRGAVDFGGAKGREYQPTADDPNYRGGNEQWGRTYEYSGGGRNIRTVWEFPTEPYPEAHFAVFPEALPEKCILAATSEKGNCLKCGKPWVREIEKTGQFQRRWSTNNADDSPYNSQ
ncbi:MAG: site-specific DNA-methyltransferase, partial [Desulfobacteraceae bacterium]